MWWARGKYRAGIHPARRWWHRRDGRVLLWSATARVLAGRGPRMGGRVTWDAGGRAIQNEVTRILVRRLRGSERGWLTGGERLPALKPV